MPHLTALMKLTTRCGEDVVAGLNEALWAKAAGKLVRTVRRVQAAGGATGTKVTDRRRAAARRVRQIASKLRTRGKLSREESTQAIRRVTGELAGLAEKMAAESVAVLRYGRRALPKALSRRVRGRLRRALDELAVTIERTAKIVAQARTRLAGQVPQSATRLVSLHDPDARPIRKGRIGQAGRVRVQGPGHRQRRRHHPRLQRRIRRRPGRPATGARGRAHPPHRPRATRGDRRPRLRPASRLG